MTAQPALKRREPAMVEGEFVFTEGDFRKIAAMVHGDAGIALHETKATLVYSRLAKRLRALGLASFHDYCALVAGHDGVDERQKMLAALTTNVTRFFREPHHFDHLRDKLLPPLLAKARAGGKIRIWSAAYSSGQEPYSVAMTVLAAAPDAGNLDIKVLATDIDPNMVAEARSGIYAPALLAGIPDDYRRKWTAPSAHRPGAVQVAEEARALITFNELNLIGDWPMKGRFDAIFCRNVAIYFDDDTQGRLWSRFAPLLPVGGRLYIGHSERVAGPAAACFEPDGITTYRLSKEAVR
ncbi:MAG TPA: protein-glutamate O-methyltransferase [Phenylobacterium sp.]|uniref:CheR family methyltransferase n=1 Tax=Phenylobacterium sp. TaxID=1871053 RepID=UPI002D519F9C|nr:protein-glutamate O-methyltransferase [Phenylobacterium sp.]HZZ68207.1 protein-glutamate O-methyltransferase [Phenylobacterium sp.]